MHDNYGAELQRLEMMVVESASNVGAVGEGNSIALFGMGLALWRAANSAERARRVSQGQFLAEKRSVAKKAKIRD